MREDVIIFESGIGSNGRSLQGEIQFNVITFNAAMAASEKQMLGTIVLGEPFATCQVGAQDPLLSTFFSVHAKNQIP